MEKLKIKNEDTGSELRCLFNPTEYTIQKSINWNPKQQTGEDVGKIAFTGGSPRNLSMELLFDVLEEKNKDVRDHVDELWKMALVEDANKHVETQKSRPPICTFVWGKHWSFRATITSLSVRYTLFRSDGTPVRAMCSIQLQEAFDEKKQQSQNPTSRSEPGLKCREVRPYDTLAWIAFEEYGDATMWRHIAQANHLDDPMNLTTGQMLAIPRLK